MPIPHFGLWQLTNTLSVNIVPTDTGFIATLRTSPDVRCEIKVDVDETNPELVRITKNVFKRLLDEKS